jgi:chitin synthase
MDGMLFTGVVDNRNSPQCQFSNWMLLVSTAILVAIIGVKFFAALQFSSRTTPEEHDKFVICCIPCYTEGVESLTKTFESFALSRYDAKRKLMFIIADGMITGAGNDMPTPNIVLKVLGWQGEDPEAQLFQSLAEGSKRFNMAKVYSGLYHVDGAYVPYIVVVKVGNVLETTKAGNRGKRDSQMILLQFLSRVHFQEPMNPLELDLYDHIQNVIGFRPEYFEFILWVDADTEIYNDSINRMVSCLVHDSRIIGICGETLIKNESDSWVTMIQVYEYFISHHMAKAFESLFGSVTCLPGCFCMYRIKSPDESMPYIIHKNIVKEYGIININTLHMKNLLTLGEDRYLTTLMMKFFPGRKLNFTQDAKALTVVPEKWNILISQRRRWINSTIHNLFELLMLKDMCGFSIFSMRFIVFMDLFATAVQPAGLIYVAYLIYSTLTDENQQIPIVSLIMIASIYGLQGKYFNF